MYNSTTLMADLARARHEDLLAQAAHGRLVRSFKPARTPRRLPIRFFRRARLAARPA